MNAELETLKADAERLTSELGANNDKQKYFYRKEWEEKYGCAIGDTVSFDFGLEKDKKAIIRDFKYWSDNSIHVVVVRPLLKTGYEGNKELRISMFDMGTVVTNFKKV